MAQNTSAESEDGVKRLLSDPRFELLPFDSFGEQLRHLPEGATVTITASPQLELGATIEAAEEASDLGYEPVPHVSARYVRGPDHLREIVESLEAIGVTDIFVPGGDREEPIGEFESAYDLLVSRDELDHPFEEVGITGYPEGHPFLSEETLAEWMQKKAPYATYIATQLCYDPEAVLSWIRTVRDDHGVGLPIEVGTSGVMKYQRLLSISQQVGVGDSIRYIQKTQGILGFVRQLIGSGGKYTPDDLVDGIAPYVGDSTYNIRGLHINTFNQVPDTEEWRRSRLGR